MTGRFHASVAIERSVHLGIKAHMLQLATHRSVDNMTRELRRLPFEPYARVRRQYLNILRAVNKKRKAAGFEMVPSTALRLHRKWPKVYAQAVTISDVRDVA